MGAILVVILSEQSLFAEGLASSLRRRSSKLAVGVMDVRVPDLLEQIKGLQPKVVILDDGGPALRARVPVDALLGEVPNLLVIRIDPAQEQVQLLTGEHRPATTAADLVEVIASDEASLRED